MPELINKLDSSDLSKDQYIKRVLHDYWIACLSREASILGRREVLTGKAKFGILGDGKEIPQVALSHFFNKGDFRSGYYRDQTWMLALGLTSIEDYFAQLYADPVNDPFSGGRQMNNHFATRMKDENDNWLKQSELYNVSSDISSTAGQMARAFGLATASSKYRKIKEIDTEDHFSKNGDEIVFCSIGDASTSEGIFWETLNAASVAKVPLAILVWDDGYGISVPVELQTTKGSISHAAEGFEIDETGAGIHIYKVKGWDYPSLINVYDRATKQIRENHIPVLIHVQECTQPQGHSTSGSHERYKSKERLDWEKEFDGIKKMQEWIIDNNIADASTLETLRAEAKKQVKTSSKKAWSNYKSLSIDFKQSLSEVYKNFSDASDIEDLKEAFSKFMEPSFSELLANARTLKHRCITNGLSIPTGLDDLINEGQLHGKETYNTHLYSQSEQSALNVPVVPQVFSESSNKENGYSIINQYFDIVFERYPNTFAFGEDVGNIGDVNQGFAGLQDKYGADRIFDTGIREWSIVGQAIGMAMRGLRPIAEIQYLDYLIYGLTPMTDDLATLRYRSNNLQMAPAIIRTRGHRLEGIWHAGSPLGMMIHALRGMYICVPRNFVQAAGMYNTLLQATDPAIVVEVLNGYRLKELKPDNLGDYTIPLGMPEVMTEGKDLTIVTYGPCVRYCQTAIERLSSLPISIELIDVQTLIPFDLEKVILSSLQKTNRILFVDEDVPGGATAYMMQKVLEEHGGYHYLDAKPRTLTAEAHRTPFGSDGDYFTKPQIEDIVDAILEIIED